MSKIFITLISEQTIPNLQYLKEFGPFDSHYFISTESMEKKGKTKHIIEASQIKDLSYEIIEVSEESLSDIRYKLEKVNFSNSDQLIVNCTLGTKIMSIALFDFFKNSKNASLYYTPIGTNKYVNILDEDEHQSFRSQISIIEYFACYGITITKTSKCLCEFEQSEFLRKQFKTFGDIEYGILEVLRVYRDRKWTNISEVEYLNSFLRKIQFKPDNVNKLSKYEVQYLTGGWFEEWVFYKIKNLFSLPDDQIGLGIVVNAVAENDLDLVYIHDNNLHVIECKTSLGKDLQQATIYKSGALIDKFGRSAKSYLYTMQNLRNSDGSLFVPIELRSRQQNVTILDKADIENIAIK